MTSTAITALRRGRAVDPGQVLTGPLRGVGLSWLDPQQSIELTADGVEHTLYVTAGAGRASTDETDVPLAEGTAVTLPLGGELVLTAGESGLEYFHAVLAVPGEGPR
ncbi:MULTISPECIES: hypothetical protein [unclassified Kitasatospora]|uniref:hypothetical protein n=1 Tax=unclassified Kitasatospora TaxID=2633591 RepID=UPI00070BA791|nr:MULTISPECIES: hypothetical protein [unclassified Kitasatospora]KQV04505.1 hypothetical protein ASC99_13950 [Kitasatospora sp. Root107]KRB60965.1 hypothetical protein ASE03_11555 [Kitasatospora sp. Root187]